MLEPVVKMSRKLLKETTTIISDYKTKFRTPEPPVYLDIQ